MNVVRLRCQVLDISKREPYGVEMEDDEQIVSIERYQDEEGFSTIYVWFASGQPRA